MKLRIGISPCPNDTYIFDALYSKKIDISPFEFEFIFEDVETLNRMASESKLDILKLSYAHYFNVIENYVMFTSGGALGHGVGPLLISKKNIAFEEVQNQSIGIPGIHTTAHFLLNYAFPNLTSKREYLFSEIEQAVLNEEVALGVIIHENRFTYEAKGLRKVLDLGDFWEQKTDCPIPLGGIAIQRSFDDKIKLQLNLLIKKSILFAQTNMTTLSSFVKSHAQEMNEDVMRQHINLYVNEYSVDLGVKGTEAVQKMADTIGNTSTKKLFI